MVKETQSNLEVENCTDVRQLQEEWYEIRSSTSKMSWADEVEAMPDPTKNHLSGIILILLRSQMRRLWAKWGINKVAMLQNGVVLVKFETAPSKNDVVQ
ncbi:hypothetical protein KY289_016471 [Solanum tuberosum]|nr:hypothetical protein KY289_016471 [Solanum tuberosum]